MIYDAEGRIVFSEMIPTDHGNDVHGGTPWGFARGAAKAAWEAAPTGFIELKGSKYEKRISLYGFRELWEWGLGKCSFPSLDALPHE